MGKWIASSFPKGGRYGTLLPSCCRRFQKAGDIQAYVPMSKSTEMLEAIVNALTKRMFLSSHQPSGLLFPQLLSDMNIIAVIEFAFYDQSKALTAMYRACCWHYHSFSYFKIRLMQ